MANCCCCCLSCCYQQWQFWHRIIIYQPFWALRFHAFFPLRPTAPSQGTIEYTEQFYAREPSGIWTVLCPEGFDAVAACVHWLLGMLVHKKCDAPALSIAIGIGGKIGKFLFNSNVVYKKNIANQNHLRAYPVCESPNDWIKNIHILSNFSLGGQASILPLH